MRCPTETDNFNIVIKNESSPKSLKRVRERENFLFTLSEQILTEAISQLFV